jgi:hypothetical protein
MEFSYRISKDDYKQAFKLRLQKNALISGVTKTIMFWVFILICLVLLWAVVQRTANTSKSVSDTPNTSAVTLGSPEDTPSNIPQNDIQSDVPTKHADNASLSRALTFNLGPFLLLAAIWLFMIRSLIGNRGLTVLGLIGSYNRDPLMQGQFTVNLTSTSISSQNSAGYSARLDWSLFESWREGKSVIALIHKSGTYSVLGIGGLSDAQKLELRGILAAALPRK